MSYFIQSTLLLQTLCWRVTLPLLNSTDSLYIRMDVRIGLPFATMRTRILKLRIRQTLSNWCCIRSNSASSFVKNKNKSLWNCVELTSNSTLLLFEQKSCFFLQKIGKKFFFSVHRKEKYYYYYFFLLVFFFCLEPCKFKRKRSTKGNLTVVVHCIWLNLTFRNYYPCLSFLHLYWN